MKYLINRLIYFLQHVTIFLQDKLSKKSREGTPINSLAPKVLTNPSDIEKIRPYLDNLEQAIHTKGINNIAITGSYGSGKSTILKTFQHLNGGKEYRYLNLSLASFKDNKEDKEAFERQLEISLLQQMFYHVKSSKIPDSRFKRIVNVTWKKLTPLIVFLISWIFSGLFLFKFEYIESLNPKRWQFTYAIDWIAVLSSIIFFIGIGLIVKNIYRLFANSKINKLSIKGELELGGAVDNSVFNKHLEEILYFFERTEFNILVIEDVDRFKSTDIFTKLREINILLNNSELIQRPIKFLYAIKDEMFTDKTERVKFFDFIIPIIPFINPSNANDQLAKLVSNADLKGVLSEDFTSDIITFIDDIDMRLLINIFQEYQVYRKTLNISLTQDNLFAILIYKNIYPDDFGDLARRRGKLYTFFSQKNLYISKLRDDLKTKIEEIDYQIKSLENEVTKPVEELRAVYINSIIPNLTNFHAFDLNGKQVSVNEAIEDEYFNEIKKGIKISYHKYAARPGYGQIQYQRQTSTIKLSDIEKEISSSLTYLQREKLLFDKSNDQVEVLKQEKEKLRNRILELEKLSIKEIFALVEINDYLVDFDDSYLMRNLLLNGYIDEHFDDYISLFHEVTRTKSDFDFERSVRAGVSLVFEYKLNKTENVIKRLPKLYFQRDAILNYSLLTCLLDNRDKFGDNLADFIKYLSVNEKKQFDFILGFISACPQNISLFMELLCAEKSDLWFYIKTKSELPDSEIRVFVKLIFEYANLDDISKFANLDSLTEYFEELQEPLAYFSTFQNVNNVEKFISNNQIRFVGIDQPVENQAQLFQLIYSKNHYQINEYNIQAIIKGNKKEFDSEELQRSHYTTLLQLDLVDLHEYINSNIEEYVSNVMTFMKDNTGEAEETILNVLNREEVSLKLKETVLDSQNMLIRSINEIEDLEVKQLALNRDRIIASWGNIFEYYNELFGENESDQSDFDEVLLDFLNKPSNYEELSKMKLDTASETVELIKEISNKLLHCHKLNDEAFAKLLDSLPYVYRLIRYDEFSSSRINILLDKEILTLSPENFEGLKEVDSGLSVRLIEDKQDKFIKDFINLSLDSDDWFSILKSAKINYRNKLGLIQAMDNDIIIDNEPIAKIVCDILPVDKYIPMDYEVLESVFKASYSTEKRVVLLNLHFSFLTNEQTQALTEKLGGKYKEIFFKQHKPTFPNTYYNLKFFENLQDQDLIIRYEVKEKKDELKVFAKY